MSEERTQDGAQAGTEERPREERPRAGERTRRLAESYLTTRAQRRAERRSAYAHEDEDERRRRKRSADHRRDAKRGAEERVLRLVAGCVRSLPLGFVAACGHALGTLLSFVPTRARRRVRIHLELALGDELTARERRRIERRVFAYLLRGSLSYFVLHRMGAERALQRVTVEGRENLESARDAGKGALVVSFHYGLFELIGVWTGNHVDGVSVSRPVADGAAGATGYLIQLREDLGCKMVQRGNARVLLRQLKRGGVVGLAADHDLRDSNGVFVPFFGILAHSVTGPATLALKTGAPLVPAFIHWEGLTRHRIVWHEPIWPRSDLPREEAIAEMTYRFQKVGEAEVRKRPEHWLWTHKRWETRPADVPDEPVHDPAGEARIR